MLLRLSGAIFLRAIFASYASSFVFSFLCFFFLFASLVVFLSFSFPICFFFVSFSFFPCPSAAFFLFFVPFLSCAFFFFALFWPCFLFSELSYLAPPFCLSRRPAGSTPGRSDLHVLGTGGVARALAEGGVCWPYVRSAWTDLGALLALYVRLCMFAHVSRMLPRSALCELCWSHVAPARPCVGPCWP